MPGSVTIVSLQEAESSETFQQKKKKRTETGLMFLWFLSNDSLCLPCLLTLCLRKVMLIYGIFCVFTLTTGTESSWLKFASMYTAWNDTPKPSPKVLVKRFCASVTENYVFSLHAILLEKILQRELKKRNLKKMLI